MVSLTCIWENLNRFQQQCVLLLCVCRLSLPSLTICQSVSANQRKLRFLFVKVYFGQVHGRCFSTMQRRICVVLSIFRDSQHLSLVSACLTIDGAWCWDICVNWWRGDSESQGKYLISVCLPTVLSDRCGVITDLNTSSQISGFSYFVKTGNSLRFATPWNSTNGLYLTKNISSS